MTSENLAKLVGAIISLLLGWFPVVSTWFDKLPSKTKALIAAGVTIAVALVLFGASCAKLYQIPGLICSKQGFQEWAVITINALIGLVGAYMALVRPFKAQ
jgi:hypothetical protein